MLKRHATRQSCCPEITDFVQNSLSVDLVTKQACCDALHKTMYEFVWNRKQVRIRRKIAIKSIAKGGLGIPKLRDYINALKLILVRKFKKKKKNLTTNGKKM